jgi:hypothetical protein
MELKSPKIELKSPAIEGLIGEIFLPLSAVLAILPSSQNKKTAYNIILFVLQRNGKQFYAWNEAPNH